MNHRIIKLALALFFGVYILLFFSKEEDVHMSDRKFDDKMTWGVLAYYDYYRIPDIYYYEGKYIQKPNNISNNLIFNKELFYYLDRVDLDTNIVRIRGWSFLNKNEKEEIYIGVIQQNDTVFFNAILENRPDVQQAFNLEKENVGFYCYFKNENLKISKENIIVVIKNNTKYYFRK